MFHEREREREKEREKEKERERKKERERERENGLVPIMNAGMTPQLCRSIRRFIIYLFPLLLLSFCFV